MKKFFAVIVMCCGLFILFCGLLIAEPFLIVFGLLLTISGIYFFRSSGTEERSKKNKTTLIKSEAPIVKNTIPNTANEKRSDYIVFDLETTGIDTRTTEIVEIGAIKVLNGKIIDSFSSLVKPARPIPADATQVNNITNDMVKNAPAPSRIIPQFVNFIGNNVLMGYNIENFDMPILMRYAKEICRKDLSNSTIDVYKMVQTKLADIPNRKLTTVASYFNLSIDGAHRVIEDCALTNQVYLKIKDIPSAYYGDDNKKQDVNSDIVFDSVDEIVFDGKGFLLTGTFSKCNRDDLGGIITSKGGIIKTGASSRVNYLIVGSLPRSEYAYGSYGRKTEKCLELREQGKDIKIIREADFLKFI